MKLKWKYVPVIGVIVTFVIYNRVSRKYRKNEVSAQEVADAFYDNSLAMAWSSSEIIVALWIWLLIYGHGHR